MNVKPTLYQALAWVLGEIEMMWLYILYLSVLLSGVLCTDNYHEIRTSWIDSNESKILTIERNIGLTACVMNCRRKYNDACVAIGFSMEDRFQVFSMAIDVEVCYYLSKVLFLRTHKTEASLEMVRVFFFFYHLNLYVMINQGGV